MASLSADVVDVVERSAERMASLGEHIAYELIRRVKIPINATTPPQMVAAINTDPWRNSGKYALGWVYFPIILLLCTTAFRVFNYWGDKIRTALYKEEVINSAIEASPYRDDYELPTGMTDGSTRHFFPATGPILREKASTHSAFPGSKLLNRFIALVRYIFYRPIQPLTISRWTFSFPSLGVVVIVVAGIVFSLLYCLLPQPLFYDSMAYGSPPLAIRAGMMSVALMPWIIALASKVNIIAFLTGIEPQRLIVLHRWGAYICAMLAIIHAVPFWYQSVNDPAGYAIFRQWFNQRYYIFTTGIAAIAPLIFLVLHSLPILRHKAYEVFVLLHIPVSWAFVGLMFWHCHNYLTSWSYLYATVLLLFVSLFGRLFYLNWMSPLRPSWLIGEESAVTILPENAVKVTVPTQQRWKPGQYAYLRMPGIAVLDSHPFTIASLCSEDFPSDYGEQYRDLAFVFRPFGGFTKKVLDTATVKGPYKTYRAFIEGPYGGMQRQMSSFDQVIFFAGGSGITAIASQLLDLIKRMRDGKATTQVVHVFWSMKRPEIMEWFKEELRICRECAPPGSVHCNFYITAARRHQAFPAGNIQENRLSGRFADKVDDVMRDIANKRNSTIIEPDFDLKKEFQDELTALPQSTHLAPPKFSATPVPYFPPPPRMADVERKDNPKSLNVPASTISAVYKESTKSIHGQLQPPQLTTNYPTPANSQLYQPPNSQTFDFGFGFPKEPTEFQKSLMRFAFLPTTTIQPHMAHPTSQSIPQIPGPIHPKDGFKFFEGSESMMPAYTSPTFPPVPSTWRPRDGWRTEYGRPDIAYTLRSLSKDFGRRTCVFVCGPPEMRQVVSKTVAQLQSTVWRNGNEELYLHAENYDI